MKYLLFIIALTSLVHTLQGAEAGFTTSTAVEIQKQPRQVKIQLELDENDLKAYGLSTSSLLAEISTRLTLGQIQVKNDIEAPILVLRIKSIEQERVIAAFTQLAFFERATLLRNNNLIMAQTWSKATMISGPKETFSKEVSDSIISMTNTFVLDYQKALSAP